MTIRLKLTIGSIAVVFLATAVLSLVNVRYLEGVWLGEVRTRVRLDLNSARAAYLHHLESMGTFLQAAALDRAWKEALAAGDRAALARLAQAVRGRGPVDFVAVLDPRATVLASGDAAEPGARVPHPAVVRALKTRQYVAGTTLVPTADLARLDRAAAGRAAVREAPPPAEAMILAAAVPVVDGERTVGLLYAGQLLAGRMELVDSIRRLVFPADFYQGRETGTVTIFQGDRRIATNVLQRDGSRAVGTQMSDEVRQQVLVAGETWDAPATVLDQRYIAAYEPIRDPDDRIIGALYVGLLEAPFVQRRNAVSAVVVATMLVATAASLALLYLLAALVLRPIGRVTAMARRVVAGDLAARVGLCPPGEMGTLCRSVDAMADALAEREAKLKEATRQQIGQSEKLASIGRLAAGVAHEINNPLTGVLTFAHLLAEKPNLDDQDRQDLGLIIHETTRAAEIVRNLLDFARERPASKEPLEINDVIRRTVRLIKNQKKFDRIAIVEELTDDLPCVEGDMNQLQQVLLNLALNACEAMPAGGQLTIRTAADAGGVRVSLSDTGCGIKPELLAQIFEPFFTTKPVGKGTGLGLAVSYGIVQQHGGELTVESQEGAGARFTFVLPALEAPG